jgi:hypothetical protein
MERMAFFRVLDILLNNRKCCSILIMVILGIVIVSGGCTGPSYKNSSEPQSAAPGIVDNPSANDNITDYHDYLAAARPYNFDADVQNLPEISTGVMKQEEIGKYKLLLNNLNLKDPDAARWVVGMGQFIEDRTISDDEIAFADTISQDNDPLRILVTPWARDGISAADVSSAKNFSLSSGEYGYLTDDLQKIGNVTPSAREKFKDLVRRSVDDYELRKGLCIMDEYGTPNPENFKYKVPRYNTQLNVLTDVLDDANVTPDYYRLALAAGIDYGAAKTVADGNVSAVLPEYVRNHTDFFIETDGILKQQGASWQVKDYSLEEDMALVGLIPGTMLPFKYIRDGGPKTNFREDYPSWQNSFKSAPMNMAYFNITTIHYKTLVDMRRYMTERQLPQDPGAFIRGDYAGNHVESSMRDIVRKYTSGGIDFFYFSNTDVDNQWIKFRSTGYFNSTCTFNSHGFLRNMDVNKFFIEKALATSIGIPSEAGGVLKHGKDNLDFNFYPVVYYYDNGKIHLKPVEVKDVVEFDETAVSSRGLLPLNLYLSVTDGSWNNLDGDTTVIRIYRDGKDPFELKGKSYNPTTDAIVSGIPSGYVFRSNPAVINDPPLKLLQDL